MLVRFKRWKIKTGKWFDRLPKNVETHKNKWIKNEKWIRGSTAIKLISKRIMFITKWINNYIK
jgi:hypothetical protein